MHRGIHSQLLHAFDLRLVDLVDVRQCPAQILDGMLLVDGLDLVEECIDRVVQFGMHVYQRQAGMAAIPIAMRRHCSS